MATPSPHHIATPKGLARARGYSHAVTAQPGSTVWVAGQLATDGAGNIVGESWADQFDVALGNVVAALRAGGAEPRHVVDMQIFTVDVAGYRAVLEDIGSVYRRHMGGHYPAMALLGVTELVEPAALIEVTATAVVPTAES